MSYRAGTWIDTPKFDEIAAYLKKFLENSQPLLQEIGYYKVSRLIMSELVSVHRFVWEEYEGEDWTFSKHYEDCVVSVEKILRRNWPYSSRGSLFKVEETILESLTFDYSIVPS